MWLTDIAGLTREQAVERIVWSALHWFVELPRKAKDRRPGSRHSSSQESAIEPVQVLTVEERRPSTRPRMSP